MSINEIEIRLKQFDFAWHKEKIRFAQVDEWHEKDKKVILTPIRLLEEINTNEDALNRTSSYIYECKNDILEYYWKPIDRAIYSWHPLLLDEESLQYLLDFEDISREITGYLSDIIEDNSPIQERFQAVAETLERINSAFFKDNDHPDLKRFKTRLGDITWNALRKEHPSFFDRYHSWKSGGHDSQGKENQSVIIKRKLTPEICEKIAKITIDGMEFISEPINKSIKGELLFKLFTKNPQSNTTKGTQKDKLYCRDWDNNDVYYLIKEMNKYFSPRISQTIIEKHQMLYLKEGGLFSRDLFDTKTAKPNYNAYVVSHRNIVKQIDEQLKTLFL